MVYPYSNACKSFKTFAEEWPQTELCIFLWEMRKILQKNKSSQDESTILR